MTDEAIIQLIMQAHAKTKDAATAAAIEYAQDEIVEIVRASLAAEALSANTIVDDAALERGLVAVCNHKRARYHLPPMSLENLKASEGVHWPLLLEETRVALTAALSHRET